MKTNPGEEELEVTALAFGGDAVARRASGKVCFFPGVIPGEKAVVRITEEKKNYSYGTAEKILNPSPRRIPFSCPNKCPGCSYAHMEYALELEWKQKQLESFIVRLKKMKVKAVLPPLGAERRFSWRNKIRLTIGPDGKAGFIARDNKSLIEIKECRLAADGINQALSSGKWRELLTGDVRSVTFRHTQADGTICFADSSSGKERVLTEDLGKYGKFRAGERCFFQINTEMAQFLAERFLCTVKECMPERIMELYCGCGLFSILAAECLGIPSWGIEIDEQSIVQAQINAGSHGVETLCRFFAGDAGRCLQRICKGKHLQSTDMIVADPPRTGLAPNAMKAIADSAPGYLVYVSCGPAALMRDLDLLAGYGYVCEQIGLLDLFPATAHFETFTLLKHI